MRRFSSKLDGWNMESEFPATPKKKKIKGTMLTMLFFAEAIRGIRRRLIFPTGWSGSNATLGYYRAIRDQAWA